MLPLIPPELAPASGELSSIPVGDAYRSIMVAPPVGGAPGGQAPGEPPVIIGIGEIGEEGIGEGRGELCFGHGLGCGLNTILGEVRRADRAGGRAEVK